MGLIEQLHGSTGAMVYALVGPTASGKTAASIAVASQVNIEVISADSRQVYRYMDIGTAKPSPEEQAVCPHHMIDVLNPDEYCSAGTFAESVWPIVDQIHQRGNVPLIVGGSGLYISAVISGFFREPDLDFTNARDLLIQRLEYEGVGVLYGELMTIDPESAELYRDMNPRRILRALEYYYTTGQSISEARATNVIKPNFRTMTFLLHPNRDELYKKINVRCETMWKSGLLFECASILERGYARTLNALNTVGYKQAIAVLLGEAEHQEALDDMQQATRNYAKRQVTWFRKMHADVEARSPEEIAQRIVSHIRAR